jgi:hypothetical protein
MSVEVSVFDLPAAKKWRRMWLEIAERIHKLPKWMQDIVLEDINTAIKNRVATMEMIQNAKS